MKRFLIYFTLLMLANVNDLKAQPGTLDVTFGVNGKATVPLQPHNYTSAESIAIQKDGKIVTAGSGTNGIIQGLFCIMRFTTDGVLDNSFGGDGVVHIDPSGGTKPDAYSYAWGVAVDNDGNIVATGEYHYDNWIPGVGNHHTTVIRLKPDGTLDPTFGTNGVVNLDVNPNPEFPEQGWGITVQKDNKVVVTGQGFKEMSEPTGGMTIIRLTQNGTLDVSFNGTGIIYVELGGHSEGNAVKMQEDSKIVAVGESPNGGFSVVRVKPDGAYDNSFSLDGRELFDGIYQYFGYGLDIQVDGKILVSGSQLNGLSGLDFVVVRYRHDGTLDTDFNGTGVKAIDLNQYDICNAVISQADGTILLAGLSNNNVRPFYSGTVIKLKQRGEFDSAFDTDGIAYLDIDACYDIALQKDGKIVVSSLEYIGEGHTVVCRILNSECVLPSVEVNDVYAVKPGGLANTIYLGYGLQILTLTATTQVGVGPYTYQWSDGSSAQSIFVSPNSVGTHNYNVTVTDSRGCKRKVSKEVSVLDVRCGQNGDMVQVCNVPTGNPTNVRTVCVAPQSVGALLSKGSYLGGCQASASTILQKKVRNGESDELGVRILPNPSASHFTVVLRNPSGNTVSLRVYNSLGQVVEQRKMAAYGQIDIGQNYSFGSYLLEVACNNYRQVIKLIKQN